MLKKTRYRWLRWRGKKQICINTALGFRMNILMDDLVGWIIVKSGWWEPLESKFILKNLSFEKGDVIIDVGANIGWYSLLFHKMTQNLGVKIIAFEPDPTNFSLLQQNLEMNQAHYVTAFNKGLSDSGNPMTLHLYNKKNLGNHSFVAHQTGSIKERTSQNKGFISSLEVQTMKLDECWKQAGLDNDEWRPKLMKIDVEGFELMVLRGAANLLKKFKWVILENDILLTKSAGYKIEDLYQMMTDFGYVPYRVVKYKSGFKSRRELIEVLKGDLTQEVIFRGVNIFWKNQSLKFEQKQS